MRLLHHVVLWLCLLAALAPRAAADEDVPKRPMRVIWDAGAPLIQLAARDFADAGVRNKLSSGLPQVIVTRLYAYPDSGARPVALGLRSCRIVYDLWEDVYRVQLQTETGDRSLLLQSQSAVIDLCLQEAALPLGRAADFASLRGRNVYFSVLVELNPMSPDTVQRIRRWLARPGGGGGLDASAAFFGSFVSIFVNRRIGDAEQTLSYRSQAVMVPR